MGFAEIIVVVALVVVVVVWLYTEHQNRRGKMTYSTFSEVVAANPELAREIRWYLEVVEKHGVARELAIVRAKELDTLAESLGIQVSW